ncbi:GNAT family N-acetyltransferase [Ectobacillus polymachus]|uniref:GNAT family N-acetyltransferase n=1 Tax=Ectobacillus polymachus TaxID=1508806 RepID=UPI003A8556AE
MKRLFDFIFSLFLFVLALPLFFFLTILIMLTMGTPVFLKQTRIGRHQKPFQIIKFRTMKIRRDKNGNRLSMQETKVGKFLRKLHLDELPQLVNVLKGDLSFVGPKPLSAKYLPFYTKYEEKRFLVRPGITGLSQISKWKLLSWDKRLRLDIQYVNKRSVWLDIKILLKTFVQAFKLDRINDTQEELTIDLDEERRAITIDPASFTKIRPLTASDSDQVILLIENGLPAPIFQCTIYSCRGYQSYLEALLTISQFSPEQTMVHFIGAYKRDELVGFSEWRIEGSNLHLTNLFVKPEMRGSGVGSKLVQTGVEMTCELGLRSITLDVFESNKGAISWYKRLRFKEVTTTYWYVGTNPVSSIQTDLSYKIINYATTKASHLKYDFSTLVIKTQHQLYTVGLLNKTFFKITNQSALDDIALLQALFSLDPVRSILVLSPGPLGEEFPNLKLLNKSIRLNYHVSSK